MQKGFTLIEILAVLIIISVLAIIIVPRCINFDSNAQKVEQEYEEAAQERKNLYDKLLDIEEK